MGHEIIKEYCAIRRLCRISSVKERGKKIRNWELPFSFLYFKVSENDSKRKKQMAVKMNSLIEFEKGSRHKMVLWLKTVQNTQPLECGSCFYNQKDRK